MFDFNHCTNLPTQVLVDVLQTIRFDSLPSELSERTWKRSKIRVNKMSGFYFKEESGDIEVSLYHSLCHQFVLVARGTRS